MVWDLKLKQLERISLYYVLLVPEILEILGDHTSE